MIFNTLCTYKYYNNRVILEKLNYLAIQHQFLHQGAIPATIAILKGQLTIGLTEDQIHYLAQAKGVVKASRRDLAPIAAAKLDGATTVAGTIIAAELADIPVFVTGGIGKLVEIADFFFFYI